MPETRKHHREARDALDEALFAALGEPVRPRTPGEDAPPAAASQPPAEPAPAASDLPLGSFTWVQARPDTPTS